MPVSGVSLTPHSAGERPFSGTCAGIAPAASTTTTPASPMIFSLEYIAVPPLGDPLAVRS